MKWFCVRQSPAILQQSCRHKFVTPLPFVSKQKKQTDTSEAGVRSLDCGEKINCCCVFTMSSATLHWQLLTAHRIPASEPPVYLKHMQMNTNGFHHIHNSTCKLHNGSCMLVITENCTVCWWILRTALNSRLSLNLPLVQASALLWEISNPFCVFMREINLDSVSLTYNLRRIRLICTFLFFGYPSSINSF